MEPHRNKNGPVPHVKDWYASCSPPIREIRTPEKEKKFSEFPELDWLNSPYPYYLLLLKQIEFRLSLHHIWEHQWE